jgi:hypothetical protein
MASAGRFAVAVRDQQRLARALAAGNDLSWVALEVEHPTPAAAIPVKVMLGEVLFPLDVVAEGHGSGPALAA